MSNLHMRAIAVLLSLAPGLCLGARDENVSMNLERGEERQLVLTIQNLGDHSIHVSAFRPDSSLSSFTAFFFDASSKAIWAAQPLLVHPYDGNVDRPGKMKRREIYGGESLAMSISSDELLGLFPEKLCGYLFVAHIENKRSAIVSTPLSTCTDIP